MGICCFSFFWSWYWDEWVVEEEQGSGLCYVEDLVFLVYCFVYVINIVMVLICFCFIEVFLVEQGL